MEFAVPDAIQKDSLNEGLKEHKCAVKRCNTNNGMATHTWHSVNWDAAEIKAFEELRYDYGKGDLSWRKVSVHVIKNDILRFLHLTLLSIIISAF